MVIARTPLLTRVLGSVTLLILVMTTGCASSAFGRPAYFYGDQVEVAYMIDREYPAREALPRVYLDDVQPNQPFEQLALIRVRGHEDDSLAWVMRMLQQSARQIGADAVISVRTADVRGAFGGPGSDDPTTLMVTATAVRFAASSSPASRY